MEGIQDHYTRDQPGIQWKLVSLEHLMGIIDRKHAYLRTAIFTC